MKPNLQQLMRDATRLTGGGQVQKATEVIQHALAAAGLTGGGAGSSAVAGQGPAVVVDPNVWDADEAPREGGPFTHHRHQAAGLARDYKLYLPPANGAAPMPLVVMLHGCTQDPDDFAAGTGMNALAQAQGFAVLYPAQGADANPGRCWNWFKHSHQGRGRGEPALLASMTRHVVQAHGLDARRVYIAGLSAGGAMAAIVAEAYPELFAAVGVHSGLPVGAAKDLMSAMAAMKDGPAATRGTPTVVPTIVFHADDDATVHPRNADHLMQAATGAAVGATLQREAGVSPGGRAYTRTRQVASDGRTVAEAWRVQGGGHAWSGGQPAGSYTDPAGPDASREMLRFFLTHRTAG